MADPRYKNGIYVGAPQRKRYETPVAYGWRQTPYQFHGHTMYQWPDTDLFICTTPPETGLPDDWMVFVDGEAVATFSGPFHKITAGALELIGQVQNV